MDKYFASGWKEKEGNQQTIFFCNIALNNFPKWLTNDLRRGVSLADVGCAMGECVNIFQKKFKKSKVVGIDFSPVAIEQAKKLFPENNFYCESLTDLKRRYDAIFCSNTLEHFQNPLIKLKKLMSFVNKYVIILVPFQEYERSPFHTYTFDYQNFPLAISDFTLAFSKVITTWNIPDNRWPGTPKSPGKQILVIYAKHRNIEAKKINLNSVVQIEELTTTENQNGNINSSKSELEKIYSSNFWKTAMIYYKFRDFILSLIAGNINLRRKNRGI